MDEIDIAKVQNFVDSKIIAPMNVQEQKALCRVVLEITQWINDMYTVPGSSIPIKKLKEVLEANKGAN